MKLTRRELAQTGSWLVARGLLIPSGLAGIAAAEPQASPPPQSAAEELHKNVAAVRKLSVPAATEPAFSFRAQ
jgi:hypothetical protein